MSTYPENTLLLSLVWFLIVYIILFKHKLYKDISNSKILYPKLGRYYIALVFFAPYLLFYFVLYKNLVFLLVMLGTALSLFLLEHFFLKDKGNRKEKENEKGKENEKERETYHLVIFLQTVLVLLSVITFQLVNEQPEVKLDVWLSNIVNNKPLIYYTLGYVLCLSPSNIVIKYVLTKFDLLLKNEDPTKKEDLERAGRFIGGLERVIILTLVLIGQYEAIGLLIASKSILRMKDSPAGVSQSEYVLAGTLLSFGIAVLIGIILLGINGQNPLPGTSM